MIKKNILLENYANYQIGGPAEYFLDVKSKEELLIGLNGWKQISEELPIENRKIFVMGAGTNLLIDDKGVPGLTIYNQIKSIENIQNEKLLVGSGVLMSDLVDYCVENNLSGLEWAGGLPGTVGGAIYGNAGAFGGEIKDNVISIQSINLNSGILNEKSNAEAQFCYRSSFYKTNQDKDIIISAIFQLKNLDREIIEKSVKEKIEYRQKRQPLEYPSAGSTFKNVDVKSVPTEVYNKFMDVVKTDPFPVIPAAAILAEANLQGRKVGGAMISEKHPNFIINVRKATSEDVLGLINVVVYEVQEKYGITLEPEIIRVP